MSGPSLFPRQATDYARFRIDYPESVVDAALQSVGVVRGDVVADLGSGTGLLSRWFLERGTRVFGVEPDPGMRHVAERTLGRFGDSFTSIDGTAERTSLSASSVTVVAAGNAFHYFDPRAARMEVERILQRGGRVLIVGHDSASTPNDFMQAYLAFVASAAPPETGVFHQPDRVSGAVESFFAGSRRQEEDMGDHTFHLPWDALRGRFLSTFGGSSRGRSTTRGGDRPPLGCVPAVREGGRRPIPASMAVHVVCQLERTSVFGEP